MVCSIVGRYKGNGEGNGNGNGNGNGKGDGMRDTSVIEVNLSAIDRNLRALRSFVGPECGLCPIIKADAYGLGGGRIARRLAAGGADLLAVYSPEQAAAVTRSAVGSPILVLMPLHDLARTDELYRPLVLGQLHLVLHDADQLAALASLGERFGAIIPVHLEIDTGMSRGGTASAEVPGLLRRLASTRWLRLAGIFTHFSDARSDEARTDAQLAVFDALIAAEARHIPPTCVQHVASTYSLLRHRRFHRAMVRFGLAWCGYGPELLDSGQPRVTTALEPAVTWSSRLVQVKTIEAGTSVGYGSLWTARRRSVIGLIPVGYSDGFPLARPGATGSAQVAVIPTTPRDAERVPGATSQERPSSDARRFVPVIGAVNMDQISVDLTDVMDAGTAAAAPVGSSQPSGHRGVIGVGTRVELISPDPAAPNHLPRVAAAAGTIPHELLCRLSPSIRRVYGSETATLDDVASAARSLYGATGGGALDRIASAG